MKSFFVFFLLMITAVLSRGAPVVSLNLNSTDDENVSGNQLSISTVITSNIADESQMGNMVAEEMLFCTSLKSGVMAEGMWNCISGVSIEPPWLTVSFSINNTMYENFVSLINQNFPEVNYNVILPVNAIAQILLNQNLAGNTTTSGFTNAEGMVITAKELPGFSMGFANEGLC